MDLETGNLRKSVLNISRFQLPHKQKGDVSGNTIGIGLYNTYQELNTVGDTL